MNPMVWLARDAAGEVRGGAGDWVCVATPRGWERAPGAADPPHPDTFEALAELCGRAHDARLLFCSVDAQPWPDAAGPWRIEAPFRVLWPEDEAA